MSTSSINFNDKKSKKSHLYIKSKKIFNTYDIDVNKILVSKKETYGKYNSSKYFIGYNDNRVIRPLYLFISQMTGYIYKFDKNKITMSLIIKYIQLFKKYMIWKKNEKLMKIDSNPKTTYDDDDDDDDKYIKTKIKHIKTNFNNKQIFIIKMGPRKYQSKMLTNNNFRLYYLCI